MSSSVLKILGLPEETTKSDLSKSFKSVGLCEFFDKCDLAFIIELRKALRLDLKFESPPTIETLISGVMDELLLTGTQLLMLGSIPKTELVTWAQDLKLDSSLAVQSKEQLVDGILSQFFSLKPEGKLKKKKKGKSSDRKGKKRTKSSADRREEMLPVKAEIKLDKTEAEKTEQPVPQPEQPVKRKRGRPRKDQSVAALAVAAAQKKKLEEEKEKQKKEKERLKKRKGERNFPS